MKKQIDRGSVRLAAYLAAAVLGGCGGGSSTPDSGAPVDSGVDAATGDASGHDAGGACVEGASCDDGLFCTVGDVCTAGVCAGTARSCDDGVACDGTETCDETADRCGRGTSTCATGELCDVSTDACVTACTGCAIGGLCYGDGQINPANQCESCDAATSRTAFSPRDGAHCDDGAFCTVGDVCAAGTCAGTPRSCTDGVDCNGTETCDEVAGACAAGTTTCATGELCDTATDACVTTCGGCVVGSVCFGAGQVDPTNACNVCDPMRSRTAFSANDGARCDDASFCTVGDVCTGGACAGTARDCSDGVACNGVETCDDAAGVCARGTTTCAATEICDVISDVCVTACAGCVIGGVCYAPNTINPANPCEACDVTTSATTWTSRTGNPCDDGSYCTVGETCSAGGVCSGGTARTCSDAVGCNGVETCDDVLDTCVAGTTTCGAGLACDPPTDSCVTSCGGGTTMCGSSCVDTMHDPANCLGCGNGCSAAHSTPVCAGGCRYICDAGFADCDTSAPDCETNTMTDSANCGRCGNACTGTFVCVGGTCAPPTNYMQTATTATWIDACATAGHTEYLPGDDDGSATIPLPFSFYFWGTLRAAGTNAAVSTNGYFAIPSDFSGGYVAPHLGDNYGRTPNVCVVTVGAAPNRQLVVEWRDQLYYPPGSFPGTHNTYEIILNESGYTIDAVFNTMTLARSQTTAVVNASGTTIGACPGGGANCTPASGYATRWTPSP